MSKKAKLLTLLGGALMVLGFLSISWTRYQHGRPQAVYEVGGFVLLVAGFLLAVSVRVGSWLAEKD